jgi:hypothetical protein
LTRATRSKPGTRALDQIGSENYGYYSIFCSFFFNMNLTHTHQFIKLEAINLYLRWWMNCICFKFLSFIRVNI